MNSPADPSPPTEPRHPPSETNPNSGIVPPVDLRSAPPVISDLPTRPAGKPSSTRPFVAKFLSAGLWFFLAAGVVSLLDDSLVIFWNQHLLTALSAMLAIVTFLLLVLVYCLMGLTPVIPKRVFLPIMLLSLLSLLTAFPALIFFHERILQLDWLFSLLQVVLVLCICHLLRGAAPFRWSIVEIRHLGSRSFSWLNLSAFLLLNGLVLLPALVACFAVCAGLAVSHFTDGFVKLRPGGLILQARTYRREDGKRIVLFPMSHIAEADFYQAVAQSVASNSIVLLEGVTDDQNRLTNRLSYQRAAKSLGLAEQHQDLNIHRGELIRADVDVHEFSSNTIALLNLVALVHSRGLNPSTLSLLVKCSPTPEAERELLSDLLWKRNEHLLAELQTRLPDSDNFVIPWGAAHMPGIARAIQRSGFRLIETHEYVSIRFGSNGNNSGGPGKVSNPANSK